MTKPCAPLPAGVMRPLAHADLARPDALAKLGGNPGYLSDRIAPGQLRGAILGSPHPHARIVSIDTAAARALPGVHAVVTHADIPGQADYGLRRVDRPALCRDRVRYVGDAVAAVAADSLEIAHAALDLIAVEYELLPAVTCPEAALRPEATAVHAGGNLLHQHRHRLGDDGAADAATVHRVGANYETPRQMHAFLETEGGVAEPDGQGGLCLYFANHNPERERQVVAALLDLPPERVHSVGTPVGGSYGGKDELTVQPIAALLAWKTGRSVRLHLGRAQSTDFGVKRHPMRIQMESGCDARGQLTYHRVQILADTGAYATHGPEVLDAALEHAPGPYAWQSIDIAGRLAYTNNGVAGAFRGFGAVQVQFALEQQMDRLARAAGLDAADFRAQNLKSADAPGPLGQIVVPFDGPQRALAALVQHPLWTSHPERHWIDGPGGRYRHGIGLALVHRSDGFGKGFPFGCRMELALAEDGAIELRCGFTELGQNLLSAVRNTCVHFLRCDPDEVRPVLGDTRCTPDSGPVAASRATTLVWHALQRAAPQWRLQLCAAAALAFDRPLESLGLGMGGIHGPEGLVASYVQLARQLGAQRPVITIDQPPEVTPSDAPDTHYVFGACAAAAHAVVDSWTGSIRITEMALVGAVGPVVSPMGYLGQLEGGALMGQALCTQESLDCIDGHYQQRNLDSYLIPTLADAPVMDVWAIEGLPERDTTGPRGTGEISVNIATPACANAIACALQSPIESLPVRPATVFRLLEGVFA